MFTSQIMWTKNTINVDRILYTTWISLLLNLSIVTYKLTLFSINMLQLRSGRLHRRPLWIWLRTWHILMFSLSYVIQLNKYTSHLNKNKKIPLLWQKDDLTALNFQASRMISISWFSTYFANVQKVKTKILQLILM